MTDATLRNLLFRRFQTVQYSRVSVQFLDKKLAASNAGFGVEVDGDALANARAAL